MASLELPSGIKILNPKPIGEYDEFKGVDIDTAKANALAGIPSALRYKGMKVTLVPDTGGVEYWAFINGILDTDFVNIAEYYNNLPLIDNGLTYDVLSNTIKLGGSLIDLSTIIQLGGKVLSFLGNNNGDTFEVVNTNYVNIQSGEFKIESINVSANLPRPIYLHSGEDFTDSVTNDTFHFPLSIYNNSGKQRLLSEESFSSIYSYILSGVAYKGTWNANTNTPTIPSADSTNKGYYYVVEVAGTTVINDISDWEVGDWIISNGSVWQKVDNTDAISSFNGSLGAITYTPQGTADRITVTGASGLTPTFDISPNFTLSYDKITSGGNPLINLTSPNYPKWNGTQLVDSLASDNGTNFTIASSVTTTQTHDLFTGANSTSTTKTINIGSGTTTGGNVAINLGTLSASSSVINLNGTSYLKGTNFVNNLENYNGNAGSISLFPSLTTGTVNLVNGASFGGTLNIATGVTTTGTKTVNLLTGTGAGGTGVLNIGSATGTTTINFNSGTNNITSAFSNSIRIGNNGDAAGAGNAGAIRYNSGSLEFSNGTSWLKTTPAGSLTTDYLTKWNGSSLVNSRVSVSSPTDNSTYFRDLSDVVRLAINADGTDTQINTYGTNNNINLDNFALVINSQSTGRSIYNKATSGNFALRVGRFNQTTVTDVGFNDNSTGSIDFRINSVPDVFVIKLGQTSGIFPNAVKIGNSADTASVAGAGAIRYNSNLQFSDGNNWLKSNSINPIFTFANNLGSIALSLCSYTLDNKNNGLVLKDGGILTAQEFIVGLAQAGISTGVLTVSVWYISFNNANAIGTTTGTQIASMTYTAQNLGTQQRYVSNTGGSITNPVIPANSMVFCKVQATTPFAAGGNIQDLQVKLTIR